MKTLIALTLAGLFACGTAFAADTKAPAAADTKAPAAKTTLAADEDDDLPDAGDRKETRKHARQEFMSTIA